MPSLADPVQLIIVALREADPLRYPEFIDLHSGAVITILASFY